MLLAVALYADTLRNPFVYDDFRTVVDNGTIATLRDPLAIVQHEWTRPLTNLSFAVDRALWGPTPFGFHLTNVALHAFNIVLVFLLARRVCRRVQPRRSDESASPDAATIVAAITAVLFASHPVMSEAVAYISSRADLLCACGFLLALLAADRWLEHGRTSALVSVWFAWLFALLAKETAIVFPLVLFALTRVEKPSPHARRPAVSRTLVAMFAVMLAAAGARVFVLLRVEGAHLDTASALSSAVAAAWTYVRLVSVLVGQSIFHAATPLSGPGDLRLWGLLALTGVAGIFIWRAEGRLRAAAFGVGVFIATLAPALLSSGQGTDGLAEHRLYLPAAGFALLCGSFAGLTIDASRRSRVLRPLVPLAIASLILSLCGRTYIRTLVWSDPLNLWQEAVTLNPDHWLPRAVLGETLHAQAMHADAVAAFRSSLERRPENEGTLLNLVVCLSELNRGEEAQGVVRDYEREHPSAAAASIGRGAIAMIEGRTSDARVAFQQALERDSRSAMARQWLALVAEQDADTGQLLNQCYELQRLTPGRAHVDECIAQMLALQARTRGTAR